MKWENEIEELRVLIEVQYNTVLKKRYPSLSAEPVTVKIGRKYANIDIGNSGRYMVELATGNIYGIKGYGVIHRGWKFGSLATIHDWFWGEYRAMRK